MKYYSEITKKFYDKAEECKSAEDKAIRAENTKAAERKEAAEKVDAAYKAYQKAAAAYHDELKNFCSKYGTYHRTYSSSELKDELEDWITMINML